MLEIIEHSVIDSLKLLPFLFVAFLIIEYTEHKLSKKTKEKLEKSDKFAPIIGSLLGTIPQCGFSVLATNLYVTRIISIGTLIAIYLSTSDEMLPILIAHGAEASIIIKILLIKIIIGMISGFLIDYIFRNKKEKTNYHICEEDHCDCSHGILKSSIVHTLKTFVFILIITFGLNLIIHSFGEDYLENILKKTSFLTPFISGLIGLIPNCASSVLLTELYISDILPLSGALAGLLVNSGVALLVLFKTNKNLKENIMIISIIYIIGVISGILLELINLIS